MLKKVFHGTPTKKAWLTPAKIQILGV